MNFFKVMVLVLLGNIKCKNHHYVGHCFILWLVFKVKCCWNIHPHLSLYVQYKRIRSTGTNPHVLASYIQDKYSLKNVHSPALCLKDIQTPPNCTTFHKCWQNISNTNTYGTLTTANQQLSTIVGGIHPNFRVFVFFRKCVFKIFGDFVIFSPRAQ